MAFELNERQRQAIEHLHGPMLVLAGAGTGKTTVLAKRIARLIARKHARPDEILAITYTDNAAAEMCTRVARELSTGCELRASTFHAYCYEMLQRCDRGFRVIDKKDLWVYLRLRLEELPLEHFRPARNPGEFLDALLAFFDRCHDELITPDKYDAYVERLRRGEVRTARVSKTKDAEQYTHADVVARCGEIARVFRKVEEMLRKENLGTFGHMIAGAIDLLRSDAGLLAGERARARFILIDEFQDANVGQIELAALLVGEERNVFAVGDPDQAIYRFRGASSAAFDEFRRRFPNAKGIVLNENQRSTSKVLDASFAVIARNPQVACALDGGSFQRERLQSARERREGKLLGGPVEIVLAAPDLEAADVASKIEDLYRAEGEALECAVLYRQHSHRAEVVRELTERKVPFVVHGLDALNSGDVRDALACLGAITSERDSGSLFRLASLAVFNLDAMRVREELHLAGRDVDMVSALRKVPGGEKMLAVLADVQRQARAADMKADAALELAIRHFRLPLTPALLALRKFAAEWMRKPITQTGQLKEFLQYLEYFVEAGGAIELPEPESSEPGAVRLMTVHAAKGLEFKHVFVLRATSGSFPASYRETLFEFPPELREISQEELDDREIHKQEERRLFYVAMTRAKDALALCAKPGRGKKDDSPPGFVRDVMSDAAAATWRKREGAARLTIHAGAAQPVSRLGDWLLMPAALPLDNFVLSATAIQTYKECPLAYKIRREWNVPGEIAASLHYGNAIHIALKGFYDALRAGRPQGEGELLQCFRDALAEMRFEDELQRRLYEQQGLRQLSEFFSCQQQTAAPEVVHTEKTFEVMVAGVRVRGRIDRLDRIEGARVTITDYKTGSPRKQEDADQSLQLSIYALACQQWKLAAERLIFYNLETNEAVTTRRTAGQLEDTVAEVRSVADGIAAGQFDPAPGYHCRRCGYRGMCPGTEEN